MKQCHLSFLVPGCKRLECTCDGGCWANLLSACNSQTCSGDDEEIQPGDTI